MTRNVVPPEYNFPVIPEVKGRDAFTAAKEFGTAYRKPAECVDITMPPERRIRSGAGGLGFALAFGLVWHIWWLVIVGTLAVFATMITRGFARNLTRVIPAAEVEAENERWLALVRATTPVTRADEHAPINQGLADQGALRAAS